MDGRTRERAGCLTSPTCALTAGASDCARRAASMTAVRAAARCTGCWSGYWIGHLVSTEQTHTQVQLLFARALEDQGLLGADGLPPDQGPEDPPILVAWSDNG